jgi:hypothetical protein
VLELVAFSCAWECRVCAFQANFRKRTHQAPGHRTQPSQIARPPPLPPQAPPPVAPRVWSCFLVCPACRLISLIDCAFSLLSLSFSLSQVLVLAKCKTGTSPWSELNHRANSNRSLTCIRLVPPRLSACSLLPLPACSAGPLGNTAWPQSV